MTALLLTLAPAGAHAATVNVIGTELHIIDVAGAANAITVVRGPGLELIVTDVKGAPVPGFGCSGPLSNSISCVVIAPSKVVVQLGDGDDRFATTLTDVPLDVDGGAGDDVLLGAPTADVLAGGPGQDDVFSRDAVRDEVSCGPEDDVVTADRLDVLTGGCEAVDLPPSGEPAVVEVEKLVEKVVEKEVPGPAAPSVVPAPLTPPAIAQPAAPPVVTLPPLAEPVKAQAATGTVAVVLGCPEAQEGGCKGDVSITAGAKPVAKKAKKGKARAARRGRKQVVLARARFKLRSGETKKVTAKIARRGVTQVFGPGRKAVAKAKGKGKDKGAGKVTRLSARGTMTITLRGGDGSTTRISRPVTVELER